MKGLILKDFYALWKYYKFFLLFIIAVIVFGSVYEKGLFFTVYAMIFIQMLPANFLSIDEKSGWSRFCDAMPVSRVQMVSSKYLLCLILLLGVLCLSAITILIAGLGGDALISVLGLCGGTLLAASLTLPFNFAFGAEKGRYATILLVCILAGILGSLGDLDSLATLRFLPYAGVALFPVSWLVSIPLYNSFRRKHG